MDVLDAASAVDVDVDDVDDVGWSGGSEWFRGLQCTSVVLGVWLLSTQTHCSFSDHYCRLSDSQSCRERCR